MAATLHNLRSSQREAVLEHLLLGEILRYMWLRDVTVEILRPAVDAAGYDVVLESNSVIRHIQLKTSHMGSSTARIPVNIELAKKPSGCIIWSWFSGETLQFDSFLWYGSHPGDRLPSLKGLVIAKHTRGDSSGVKRERPMIRMLPKGRFTRLASIDELIAKLFSSN